VGLGLIFYPSLANFVLEFVIMDI